MTVAQKEGIDQRSQTNQISYDDLYQRWEEGNWKATEIDFTADREGWQSLTEIQRRSAMWIFSMFFYGEDRGRRRPLPLHRGCAPPWSRSTSWPHSRSTRPATRSSSTGSFKEVIGVHGSTLGETLASTQPELNWGYRGIFDRLDRMAAELARDRSKPKFAQAIALYHMVVEATLAQPGQHYIEDYVAKTEVMPGFASGIYNVSRDEQRHIGFGVKTLSELFAGAGPMQGRGRRTAPGGPALLAGRVHATRLGPPLHARVGLRARGHLRVRDSLGANQVEGDRLPARGHATGDLPGGPSGGTGGDRASPDHAAARGRDGGTQRAARVLPGDPEHLFRHGRPFGRLGRGRRAPADRSSGGSPTPTPGTWWSTMARRVRSPARPAAPT